jgi:hypothetical protein
LLFCLFFFILFYFWLFIDILFILVFFALFVFLFFSVVFGCQWQPTRKFEVVGTAGLPTTTSSPSAFSLWRSDVHRTNTVAGFRVRYVAGPAVALLRLPFALRSCSFLYPSCFSELYISLLVSFFFAFTALLFTRNSVSFEAGASGFFFNLFLLDL